MKGNVKVTVFDGANNPVHSEQGNNVILKTGYVKLKDILFNSNINNKVYYIQFGTSNRISTIDLNSWPDGSFQSEMYRCIGEAVATDPVSNPYGTQVKFRFDFVKDQGTNGGTPVTYNEAVLMFNDEDYTWFAHKAFSGLEKTLSNSFSFEWVVDLMGNPNT
jgi:hypothetical protein